MDKAHFNRCVAPEDLLLLACAHPKLSAEQALRVRMMCARIAMDWNRIYTTSKLHNIAPLIAENLNLAGLFPSIPESVQKLFEDSRRRAETWTTLRSARLTKVLRYFAGRNLDVMLIKGAALDFLVYQQPWHTLSDTDLMLRCRKADLPKEEAAAVSAFLETLVPKCPALELDYGTHHDITICGLLPIDFEQIWANARPISINGIPAFVMSPEDCLIASCINSCRKRYFRLKSISDIAGIIFNFSNLSWDAVIRRSRQCKCSAMSYTALLIAQCALDCPLPDGVLSAFQVSRCRTSIIRHLVARLSYSSSLSSFSSLAALQQGLPFFARHLGPPLLLKYASYTSQQAIGAVRKVLTEPR